MNGLMVYADTAPVDIPDLPTYMFTPNLVGFLSLLVSVVLPIIAALLMRPSWSAPVKGTVLLVVAFVKAVAEAAILDATDSGVVHWSLIVYTALASFLIAVGMYFGLLRGTQVQRTALTDAGLRD